MCEAQKTLRGYIRRDNMDPRDDRQVSSTHTPDPYLSHRVTQVRLRCCKNRRRPRPIMRIRLCPRGPYRPPLEQDTQGGCGPARLPREFTHCVPRKWWLFGRDVRIAPSDSRKHTFRKDPRGERGLLTVSW